ncbi:MAG: hypothetical protein JW996_06590 [Candidatus Cloacimonetes bacterium]|nr:hypothetical protein [Candidatus Cloacimonadota bacterium]
MKKNLVIKILVVLIAAVLWLQQVLLKEQTDRILIPVKYLDIPADLVVSTDTVPLVPVILSGRGLNFLLLKFSEIYFEVDASNYHYGKNKLIVNETNLIIPERMSLEIKKIDLERINYITFDRLITSSKPLEVVFESAADESYFIENRITNLNQNIEIKGPSELVNEIQSIKTRKINRKMVENGKIITQLINPHLQIELIQNNVILDVTQIRLVNRTYSLIPVEYPLDKKITIIPQKVSVMIRGPQEVLDSLSTSNIRAYLSNKDINRALSSRENFSSVNFELPSGVKLIEYTPQQIQILSND